MRFKRLETVSLLSTGILMEVSPVCLLFLPLLYYFKYIDAKLHIINERYEKIVENYLKKAFTMLVNAFLMITMISICYFKTTFLPLMM